MDRIRELHSTRLTHTKRQVRAALKLPALLVLALVAYLALFLVVMPPATAGTLTTTVDGGTSYVHLGTLTKKECTAFMNSPAVIVRGKDSIAVDGKIVPVDEALCHDSVKVALVSTQPVTLVTPIGTTTWPLSKATCIASATAMLGKGNILVNDMPVLEASQVERACSRRPSNAVTVDIYNRSSGEQNTHPVTHTPIRPDAAEMVSVAAMELGRLAQLREDDRHVDQAALVGECSTGIIKTTPTGAFAQCVNKRWEPLNPAQRSSGGQ